MIKRILLTFAVLLAPCFATAQTTYTTTQDACGGKAVQYCGPVAVVDDNGNSNTITIDNRNSFGYLYVGDVITGARYIGVYSYPTQTAHTPFYGVATYESNDGVASAQFNVYAFFVSSCSGRGCGGTLGWHYKILMGSTITVQ